MAEDKTSWEYHLTPKGWVNGTYRFFDKVQTKEVKRPKDTVETWIVVSEQSCRFAKEYSTWSLIWFDSSLSEEERRRVRKQFPKPSKDFPG
jgi:hypothetical protein